MPKKTMREMAREKLEARGFKYSTDNGSRWVMVAPCETYALLLGRNGSVRYTKRTVRGFPAKGSTYVGVAGPDSVDRFFRRS